MKVEKTEKIGKLWFEEMWSKPDLALADEIVDPLYKPNWISIPKSGPAQVKHEITYFRSVFPNLKYEVVNIIGEEDKVWIRYKGHGTHLGKAWGFEPTKKEVSFEGATILYLNSEGKVIDRWGAFCFYDILTELGVVPSLTELHKYFKDI